MSQKSSIPLNPKFKLHRPNDPKVKTDQKIEERGQFRFVGWELMRSNAVPQTGLKEEIDLHDQIANWQAQAKSQSKIKPKPNQNKHCEVLVSCSDWRTE